MKDDKKVLDIEVLNMEGSLEVDKSDQSIKKVVVIGAGTMGQGISQLVASKGLDVILIEKDTNSAKKAIEGITKSIDMEIARWTMTTSEKKNILNRIATSTKMEDASMGDLVIESIPEELETKRELFKELDNICDDNTIFITIKT